MLILAVDLAERYSAAVLLQDGEVAAEFVTDFGSRDDPWIDKTKRVEKFWGEMVDTLGEHVTAESGDYRIIIEDVYPFAVQPKWVFRIQGYLMFLIEREGWSYEMILPLKWQRYFGYKKQKGRTTKSWAKALAKERGYVPQAIGKARIDLQDAFLIAEYARENLDAEGTEASGEGQVEVAH